MKKAILISLQSICKRLSFILFISTLILFLFIFGCANKTKRYSEIPYCWNSDHHLYPDERFLTLNLSKEFVAKEIIRWVNEKGGEVIENKDNFDTAAKLLPYSRERYLSVQNILEKEWKAYDENKYRKWEEGEWEKFQQLSKSQVEFTNSHDNHGYYIKTKLGKREHTIQYQEVIGDVVTYQQQYIFTKSGPIPAGTIPVHNYQYANRKKTKLFFSEIVFFIFSDQGSTVIYAVGVPLEEASSVKAGFQSTIGHSWWPMVTGKDEAALIKEAYVYLKNLES